MSDKVQKERLDKCVAKLTGLSRKEASALIKEGRVLVDGKAALEAALKIPVNSIITIDDDEISLYEEGFKKRVYMLNKPTDMVCADRDRNHRIVTSLFVDELRPETLHCAGRLDIDTTGLLIVTDDGELIHEITHPKKEIVKLYRAVTDKPIPEKAVSAFLKGLKHPEEKFPYKSAKLTIEADNVGLVEVKEGRFHEVKRLFECVGCEVIELTRLKIGSLELDESLEEGEYRLLSDDEVELLFVKDAI